jgi:hypothetical protein
MSSQSDEVSVKAIIGIVIAAVIAIGLGMWLWPQYSFYCKDLEGKANLRKAESDRQIQVEDAKSKEAAAKMLAGAEVERARGVAEANLIIGKSLSDNPQYLTWLWIEKVNENTNSVFYVPTEAGIPILNTARGIGQEKKK